MNEIEIRPATLDDASLLQYMGRETFLSSHPDCAPLGDLNHYLDAKFSPTQVRQELEDKLNSFNLLFYKGEPAGYSKIIPNLKNPLLSEVSVTKLERLYFYERFHGLKLGWTLLDKVIEESKNLRQKGLWLNVWVKNTKAIGFYERVGFTIIGDTEFQISPGWRNPNYWMFLKY